MGNAYDEYALLDDKLEEITWALKGECDDIDCTSYMYKDLLKKRYKGPLRHSFSCLPSLRRDKEAVMRLLSMKRFRKFRYELCQICKKQIDKLHPKSTIVSFTKFLPDRNVYEWKGVRVHKHCKRKVKIPLGWTKGF